MKEDNGLLAFKGMPGVRFAICNADTAFAYAGAMQDSIANWRGDAGTVMRARQDGAFTFWKNK